MIRVVVVEDEPLARQLLVKLLCELPGVEVAGYGRFTLKGRAEEPPVSAA